MKSFELKSGTKVTIDDSKIVIERTGGKSAVRGLLAGRTMGKMTMKTSAITGLIYFADYLVICASGFPTPNDFKITSIAEIKQYPNCITGKEEELEEIYQFLDGLIGQS
ncbi:hypothetical protein [Thermoactinomyces mirandus]|uniref:Uncharacterized protein n=1 Tax=Thermoactinomyces mirandus TaxID=2756294 RepID=A0A7W1XQJ0_9BACL|nr:hypothetical protein [Thermoactinomyces mirandus]MBA4601301.1 hypothetical protein [Thermoactinomyces mirandus]